MPARVAVLDASVKHFEHVVAALVPVPAQLAVLTATLTAWRTRIARCVRSSPATQHQLMQVAWGLVSALVGAATAVIVALV